MCPQMKDSLSSSEGRDSASQKAAWAWPEGGGPWAGPRGDGKGGDSRMDLGRVHDLPAQATHVAPRGPSGSAPAAPPSPLLPSGDWGALCPHRNAAFSSENGPSSWEGGRQPRYAIWDVMKIRGHQGQAREPVGAERARGRVGERPPSREEAGPRPCGQRGLGRACGLAGAARRPLWGCAGRVTQRGQCFGSDHELRVRLGSKGSRGDRM